MEQKINKHCANILHITVPIDTKKRIDGFLSETIEGYSRSFLHTLIKEGKVTVNNLVITKPSTLIQTEQQICVQLPSVEQMPAPKSPYQGPVPEIIHETSQFIVINKPAGLNVHSPSHSSIEPNVVEWLISYRHEAQHVGIAGRAGIVHRLDKDTSGIMIIALTPEAHAELTNAFKERLVQKTYKAVVRGTPEQEGIITYSISRDPHARIKMTHKLQTGREATTRFKVDQYFNNHAVVSAFPLTGRTHQIRVHFAALGHPLEGDQLYGYKSHHIKRHALHAEKIAFTLSGKRYEFFCEPPLDFRECIRSIASV